MIIVIVTVYYNSRSMSEGELLILVPMEIEAKAVRRGLHGIPGVRIEIIGIGAGRLTGRICNSSTSAVILAGFAGALRADLRRGDIVLETIPDDFRLDLDLPRGRFFTATDLIATPAAKAELCAKTGACAVEMEWEVVREKLGDADLPLIHVRVISDTADELLDESIMNWIDSDGRPKPFAIARGLLAQPAKIRTLLNLRTAVKIASPRLGLVVRTIVEAMQCQC